MHLCPPRLRNETPSVVTVNSLCCTTQARRSVHLKGDVPKMHPRPSRWLRITFWLSNPCFAGAAVGEEKGEKEKGVTRISQHQSLGTSRAYTRDARQRLIGHRLLVQSQVGRRELSAGTGRVRGTLVVVRVALVKGEAVDCSAVVKGEAVWAGATIVAKGLVVSGAGRLALAAWLEPFPLPFPPRRAFPCPLSGAPWGVLFRPRW